MRILFFVLMILSIVRVSHAEMQKLPVSQQEKFAKAVQLIDEFGGDRGMLEEAYEILVKIKKAYPKFVPAYHALARYHVNSAMIGTNRFEADGLVLAMQELDAAIEIDSKFVHAFAFKGHVFAYQGDLPSAITWLKKADAINPDAPLLNTYWGDIALSKDQYNEAITRYQREINLPTRTRKATLLAYEGLIKAYRRTNQIAKVDEYFRKGLEMAPKAAWLHGNYADFLLCEKDDFEKAIVEAKTALEIMSYQRAKMTLAGAQYRKWAEFVLKEDSDNAAKALLEANNTISNEIIAVAGAQSCRSLQKVLEAKSKLAAATRK